MDISQNVNKAFEIEDVKYYLDDKDFNDLPSQCADMHFGDPNSLSSMSNLDPMKVRELQ